MALRDKQSGILLPVPAPSLKGDSTHKDTASKSDFFLFLFFKRGGVIPDSGSHCIPASLEPCYVEQEGLGFTEICLLLSPKHWDF